MAERSISRKRYLVLPPSTVTLSGNRTGRDVQKRIDWRIPDFSKLTVEKLCVRTTFQMEITEPNCTESSLYLAESRQGLIIHLSCEIEAKAPQKNVNCYVGSQRVEEFSRECQGKSAEMSLHLWTFRAPFSLQYLQRHMSVFAPSDTLTVSFCLQDHQILANQTFQQSLGLEDLSSSFGDLFHNKTSTDVIIKVKDRNFEVHKAVLIARSSVFSAMFRHDTVEKQTGVVSVQDCDPDSFRVFLNHLYTGKFKGVNSSNASHLYVTSEKYNMQVLKSFCVDHMASNLTVENVLDVVSLAELYEEKELLSSAQEFFNLKFGKIISTLRWRDLMEEESEVANRLLVRMEPNIEIKQTKRRRTE